MYSFPIRQYFWKYISSTLWKEQPSKKIGKVEVPALDKYLIEFVISQIQGLIKIPFRSLKPL